MYLYSYQRLQKSLLIWDNILIKNIDNTYFIIFHLKPFMRFEYPYIMPQMEFKYKNDVET
jgi:hypothetical protein